MQHSVGNLFKPTAAQNHLLSWRNTHKFLRAEKCLKIQWTWVQLPVNKQLSLADSTPVEDIIFVGEDLFIHRMDM